MDKLWITIGFIAQFLFFLRFLIQWIVSEKKGESVIPIQFWYLSLAGGIMLLMYAVWRRDPVFILGQCLGSIVYVRNLLLIYKRQQPKEV